jgi:hypothetical protein
MPILEPRLHPDGDPGGVAGACQESRPPGSEYRIETGAEPLAPGAEGRVSLPSFREGLPPEEEFPHA